MDRSDPPDREAVLRRVAQDLSDAWPHYWSMRGKTKAELCARRDAVGDLPAGSLALQLAVGSDRLLRDARAGLAAAEPDFRACEAAAYLLSVAEDLYLYLGLAAMMDDPRIFDGYAAMAPARPEAEAFVRDVGIADWCADAGHPLLDASASAIRLAIDHVPAPTIETPHVMGVISRMRSEVTVPGDGRDDTYEAVAAGLRDAVAAYREYLLPALAERRPMVDAAWRVNVPGWLFTARAAMAEATRAAARGQGDDVDLAAITAFRFMAQDMHFVGSTPPTMYDRLPLLTRQELEEIADPGSEIGAWIAAHAADGRPG